MAAGNKPHPANRTKLFATFTFVTNGDLGTYTNRTALSPMSMYFGFDYLREQINGAVVLDAGLVECWADATFDTTCYLYPDSVSGILCAHSTITLHPHDGPSAAVLQLLAGAESADILQLELEVTCEVENKDFQLAKHFVSDECRNLTKMQTTCQEAQTRCNRFNDFRSGL